VILAAATAMRFSGAASAVFRVLGDRRCKRVFVIHGGLTPPALGGSAVRTFADETATCAIYKRWFTRAAGVSPPSFSEPRVRLPRDDFPRFTLTCGLNPRGANAPRSWRRARRSLPGKITPFAMHKRMCTRAAGVSPPWFGNRAGSTERFLSNEDARMPPGAYAPLLLAQCTAFVGRENNAFCGAQTHVLQERRASARRRSGIAPAMAIGFRGVVTFTTRYRMVPHGWLTRIAPGATLDGPTRIVANMRFPFARAIRFTATAGSRQPLLVYDVGSLKNGDIRGAQTHVSEERRASARRGSVRGRACRA
jgi:hypothetical protein